MSSNCLGNYKRYRAPASGVTQTCLLHACSSIHGGGWPGLVHQPLVREFESFESRRTGLKEQEAVSPQVQFVVTPHILERSRGRPAMYQYERGGRGGEGGEGSVGTCGRQETKNARCRVLPKPRTWGEAGISRGMVRLD